MKNLQEATERICELKGSQVALDALLPALIDALPAPAHARLRLSFDAHAEAARTVMLHADISDLALASFERDVARYQALLRQRMAPAAAATPFAVDPLLLTTTRISTFNAATLLSGASGFFYRAGDRLFLVSNRHVFADVAGGHRPDRIEFEVHTDPQDLTRYTTLSLPLYDEGRRQWREADEGARNVDIAALPVPAHALPADAVLQAFDETHLQLRDESIAIGDALTITGFPLGFHDTVHRLPVARNASIASAYGVRFQRDDCFLTDARTHRGSSGSPVVRRRVREPAAAPAQGWQLLGVHSTRFDMHTRDRSQDESLGLNCAWYADVLTTLTLPG